MGINERRERERKEVRDKILDAARELFATDGYDAVTMRRIADRIEYSPTALYGHFADKTALLRALCDRDFLALAQQFGRIARIEDPVERLRRAGMAYAEFGLSHPNHYRIMFMSPSLPMKAELSSLRRGNPEEDAYAFLRGTIDDCMRAGRLRPDLRDVDLVAQTVWSAVHGVVSLHIAKCKDDWIDWRPVKAVVRTLVDGMMRGLLKDEEA